MNGSSKLQRAGGHRQKRLAGGGAPAAARSPNRASREYGGRDWDRTSDPYDVNVVLYR